MMMIIKQQQQLWITHKKEMKSSTDWFFRFIFLLNGWLKTWLSRKRQLRWKEKIGIGCILYIFRMQSHICDHWCEKEGVQIILFLTKFGVESDVWRLLLSFSLSFSILRLFLGYISILVDCNTDYLKKKFNEFRTNFYVFEFYKKIVG